MPSILAQSRPALLALLCFGSALSSAQAQSAFKRPSDAVEYRQAGFELMATHFKRLNDMAQGKVPYDAKAVEENMAVIAVVSKLPFTAFVPGSDKAKGTEALPEVWSQPAKFQEAADKLQAEVGKLQAAVKSGKQEDVKIAAGAVGQSCKACHDNFKQKGH
ncbi:c-type cytochrome [Pelomonas sp. BJYL3]|uniref:c-type cytochrome n=1 Tax=Pelomonas sp. BJYL3 TaxID=2976697 RepID=UPI0022B4005F|nr:cytochrome c [Pelomonas sp. BJYL3]